MQSSSETSTLYSNGIGIVYDALAPSQAPTPSRPNDSTTNDLPKNETPPSELEINDGPPNNESAENQYVSLEDQTDDSDIN